MIWYNKTHDVRTMSPAWMFLVFPMMLVGVVAFNVLRTMDPADNRALGVLFIGYFFQGTPVPIAPPHPSALTHLRRSWLLHDILLHLHLHYSVRAKPAIVATRVADALDAAGS